MRVLLIDIDSLRPDHLGCYGYARPTSPNIDAFAAEGARCDRCYTSDSPCMPSRHGFISGRFGYHHGVVSHGALGTDFRIDERMYGGVHQHHQLLPRLLREQGAHCVGFSTFAWRHCATWFGHAWSEFHTPSLGCGNEHGEEVVDPVLDWLDRNRDREHWFGYVNIWEPHTPYNQPEEWTKRMAACDGAPAWPDEAAIAAQQDQPGSFTAVARGIATRADYQHWIDGYDGSVAYADHQVGRIVQRLQEQGIWDDTVLIITADHGEAQGEHAIYGDHVCADDCVHHIPLIVRAPGVTEPGSVLDDFCHQQDVAATLCQLFGAEIPERWDGVGLLERLRGTGAPQRPYLVWGHGLYTLQRALRTEQHLLIRGYDDIGYRQFPPLQLYDLHADPYQTHNIADERPPLLAELDHLLMDWLHEQAMRDGGGPDPLLDVLRQRREHRRRIAEPLIAWDAQPR